MADPDTCLGEGEYEALVVTRPTLLGGKRTIGELKPLYGNWNRTLNATSTAGVTLPISGRGAGDCCEVLNEAQAIGPLRTELEIWRSGDQVWTGPIRDFTGDPAAGTGEILASDRSHWATLRVFAHKLTPRGIDLAVIYEAFIHYAFDGIMPTWGAIGAGPPLVADNPGIRVVTTPVGITGDRTIAPADLKIVYAELGDLSTTGVDWTVTNGTWWAGGMVILDPAYGERRQLVLPGWLTDEHFRTPGRIRKTGESMATDTWVRGNGVKAHVGGPDPQDGVLVQRVVDAYSIEDQESADATALTYAEQGSEPLILLEGNNALEPGAPIDVQKLIPGIVSRVDLSGGGCVPYRGRLRLQTVNANWGGDGEEITVGLQPEGTSGDARGPG